MIVMVVTLAGENTYGWQAELKKLSSLFLADYSDLALERLDGDETDFSHLQEALVSLPFLSVKKMVVLRVPGKNKQFAENIEKVLTQIPESTEVIIVEPKLDRRLAYYKSLKKLTDFRDFPIVDLNGLAAWLMQAAKQRGGSLSLSDSRYLAERVGLDQQLLDSELDKLLIYDSQVTKASIDLLTDATPQSNIFQLLEAAFGGNRQKMLKLYMEQRALKVEPPQIIAMLTWQLHVLALIKTAGPDRNSEQIAKDAKLSPYVVRKSQAIAKDLTTLKLKVLIAGLLDIDLKSKRSNINSDEALQNYLLKLSVKDYK
jgi:DNA polymerase-3 subunit delta